MNIPLSDWSWNDAHVMIYYGELLGLTDGYVSDLTAIWITISLKSVVFIDLVIDIIYLDIPI